MPEPEQDDDADAGWTEDDDVAAVLLAAAVADEDDEARQGQPDPTGESTVTQPTTDPAAPPAAPAQQQPTPPPAAPPSPPSPATMPQFTAPVPGQQPPGQPAPQQPPARTTPEGNAVDQLTGADLGYPANTPVVEMSAEQQAAYWRHKAQVHEKKWKAVADYESVKQKAEQYDQLVVASQTEHERAVAEARRQGHAEALSQTGGQLVEQWVRAAAAGRLPQESVDALLQGLDRSKFLDANGVVNTDMVYTFVGQLTSAAAAAAGAPAAAAAVMPGQVAGAVPPPVVQPAPLVAAPTRVPDFGQGQPQAPALSGLEAGREIARRRFGTPNPAK